MFLTIVAIVLLVILAFLWLSDRQNRSKNSPPGPFTFPVVGVLPYFIRSSFLEKILEWKETYGKIFSIVLGSARVVIIHDYDLIKEAFNIDELTGRPSLAPIRLIAGEGKRGLIASEGAQWEAQRRFSLRHLRDFGFGKKSMEGMAHEDITDLIESIKKDIGQPISTASRFNVSIINSLWHIVAGQRYNLDSPILQNVVTKFKAAVSSVRANSPAFSMDWLLNLAPEATGWNKFKDNILDAKEFVKNEVQIHKDSWQEGNPRDFMDVFISEIRKTTDAGSSFYGSIGEENLIVGALNLFAAGTETTSSTLYWSMLYLSRNPIIQQKIQAEIDRVVGRSRLPSLSDRELMVYTNATILEVFRKSSLAPLGVAHCALSDVKFHGYTISKGTTIFANLYDVHNDKKTWGDPDVFRPERFLTPDGKAIDKNHPPIAPFSVGRRQCLGESLARNNVFLFLVSLLQSFDVNEPTGAPKVTEPFALFRIPSEFNVIFEERK